MDCPSDQPDPRSPIHWQAHIAAPVARIAAKPEFGASDSLSSECCFHCLRPIMSVMMTGMGHVQVSHLDYYLPDGRLLLNDVSFRVGQGDVAALVGPNGAGKTTLLRLVAGELKPDSGTVTTSGGLGVMPQFVGSVRDERTVRDLLVAVAWPAIRNAALAVDAAEIAIMERD